MTILEITASKYGWRCYAYCLMHNHIHLVIETPEANISAGMQYLCGRYAQAFNRSYGLSGHLFQGRFHSVLVVNEAQLLVAIRYVVLNPVRAGLCRHPREWGWSSYLAIASPVPRATFLTVDVVLSFFANDVTRARFAFRTFVFDAPPRAGP